MKLALKDWVTLAGASCGFLAIVAARYYSPWLAVGFVLAAVFFDALDGRVARRSKPDAFGRELDSLADAVSFGVAPAIIIFEAGAGFQGVTGAFALLAAAVWYCGCALARVGR
ncbi:MAG: CDP-alcohol phosphatidyltransferase family protein, partial [Candidatus Micrarchaeia archaeon]